MRSKKEWIEMYPRLAKYNITHGEFYKTEITHEAGSLLPFIPIDREFVGIEVGVAAAKTACILLHRRPKLKLILVDNWEELPERKNIADYNLSQFPDDRYRIIHKNSDEAIEEITELVDYVFIDASKEDKHYYNDIISYFAKVKRFGFMAGHDIFNLNIDPDNHVIKTLERAADHLKKTRNVWINEKRKSWIMTN